ncbi:MAG: DinB family protein [Actinomycetota bacterium]
MEAAVRGEILSLFEYVFARTEARLDGISDDEYAWEPTTDCWTVRPDGLDGDGVVADDPPVTTIGWRLCHVSDALARHPMNGLLRADVTLSPRRFPTDARAGMTYFRTSFSEWRDLIASVDDERWLRPFGPVAGPFADSTALGLALHTADEFVHHTAEIALLRDLYARRDRPGRETSTPR